MLCLLAKWITGKGDQVPSSSYLLPHTHAKFHLWWLWQVYYCGCQGSWCLATHTWPVACCDWICGLKAFDHMFLFTHGPAHAHAHAIFIHRAKATTAACFGGNEELLILTTTPRPHLCLLFMMDTSAPSALKPSYHASYHLHVYVEEGGMGGGMCIHTCMHTCTHHECWDRKVLGSQILQFFRGCMYKHSYIHGCMYKHSYILSVCL